MLFRSSYGTDFDDSEMASPAQWILEPDASNHGYFGSLGLGL